MELMTLEELMNYWRDKAEEISSNKNLDYKGRYYQFIDAYTTYLFYRNEVDDLYAEAIEEDVSRFKKRND